MSMEATDFLTAQAAASASPLLLTTHLASNSTNATSFFKSLSAKDVALSPFRLLTKIDDALFNTLPNLVGRATGLDTVSRRAATAIAALWNGGTGTAAGPVTDTAGGVLASTAGQVAAEAGSGGFRALIAEAFQTSTFKSYWGMLHYLMSRWAFTCFFMALVLNRVAVYGAPRQRIFLTWTKRLALRIVPILLLFVQAKNILQAIQCQTSPDYAIYRHGDANRYSLLDWSQDGGIMHRIVSTILWEKDDHRACAAVGLSRPEPEVRAEFGSFSLLWPTFLKLCLSHFVESLSCTLQQIQTTTEVGMSVFEHSLAFAEAETMITHALGVGVFGNTARNGSSTLPRHSTTPQNGTIPASGTILAIADGINALTGPHILDRVNVPVEVLIVALLSCGNALTAHVISVLGQQKRLRLINTGFWGICFMLTFVWGLSTTSKMVRSDGTRDPKPVNGLLHFPTVAIVGFLPHMVIILGIMICALIYLVALVLTAISLGTNPNIRQPSSLHERISIAHDNLQAAIQVKGINFRWNEDFYTALLRTGFAALTAASEAVFLNEGRSVEMKQFTWLEEERLDEIEVSKGTMLEIPQAGSFQIAEEYGLPPIYPGGNDKGGTWQSGYARERKFDKKEAQLQADGTFVYPNPKTDGVGAMQRTARFYLLFIFLRGIFFTVGGWIAFGAGALLDRVGITARPRWLRKVVGTSVKEMIDEQKRMRDNSDVKMLDFWMITEDGNLTTPSDENVDIETEMRRRLLTEQTHNVDDILDERMYDWWKLGGWFGTADGSGDFQPSVENDDATSVISIATSVNDTNSDTEADWESESDGRRTPTQLSTNQSWSFSNIRRSRSASPLSTADNPLDAATLARLLNPADTKSREEARMLSSHLASEGRMVTRSQYRRLVDGERSRVLLAGRTPIVSMSAASSASAADGPVKPRPLSQTEEAEVLEQLLITRRAQKARESKGPVFAPGTEQDEANRQAGPPCVVCQTQARTIIAWPCRCLCLCEECRVSLAMNNFGNCVTCRRNVGGFVRLYVP